MVHLIQTIIFSLWILHKMMTNYFLKAPSKSKVILALTSICILSGCMFPNSSNVGITNDKPKLSYKQVVVKQNNASPLTQSIQKIPTVARALSAATAAKDRVAITRSQKELTIQGTGSSGLETKTSDSSEGILVEFGNIQPESIQMVVRANITFDFEGAFEK